MVKRTILAIVAVFVAWQIMDFVIHGVLLQGTYAQTADLWRPMAEMKRGLMAVVGLIAATCFVCIYTLLVRPKSVLAGLKYGVIFGLGTGISMGYGTFSYMPIPYHLALSWFLSTLVKTGVAGTIVGAMAKE